jgi:nucleoid DNA-binding protein
MPMTKSEIISALIEDGVVKDHRQGKDVLDAIVDLALDELEAGEDFNLPGLCKIIWVYRPAQKKGARFKKGDEVTGFGGQKRDAEEDSPAVDAQVRLKTYPLGDVARIRPKTKVEDQEEFLKSKTGKAIVKRYNSK